MPTSTTNNSPPQQRMTISLRGTVKETHQITDENNNRLKRIHVFPREERTEGKKKKKTESERSTHTQYDDSNTQNIRTSHKSPPVRCRNNAVVDWLTGWPTVLLLLVAVIIIILTVGSSARHTLPAPRYRFARCDAMRAGPTAIEVGSINSVMFCCCCWCCCSCCCVRCGLHAISP